MSPGPGCNNLQLPDELLADIISHAAPWPDNINGAPVSGLYAHRRDLTLVCRRFYRLAMPVLYSRLALTIGWIVNNPQPRRSLENHPATSDRLATPRDSPGSRVIICLHRTLAANPNLRALCRDLTLDLADMEWCDPAGECLNYYTSDIVKWLGNTKHLHLHDGLGYGGISPISVVLDIASRHMLHLERLACTALHTRIPSPGRNLSFNLRSFVVQFPKLKELHVAGPPSNFGLHGALRIERDEGQFTEVTIHDYLGNCAEMLPGFLGWPKRLEKLTCLGRSRSGWSPIELRDVWSALVPHLLSIQSVRIGSVTNPTLYSSMSGMLTGVDFTFFGALTFLSLSYWATGSGPGEGCLLAPHLHTFEWTFDADDSRPLFLNHFAQEEEDFLRRLTEAAIERKVPLRNIDIVFTPAPTVKTQDEGIEYLGVMEAEFEYPWDRMDRLAHEMRLLGIALWYNKPSVSREQFETAVFITQQSFAAVGAL